MKQVFVDTSGWVALKHKQDTFWQKATALNRTLLTSNTRYVTSNYVLDETYTLLLYRIGHAVAGELGEEIHASQLITIEFITTDQEEKAWQLFKRYRDKTLVLPIARHSS